VFSYPRRVPAAIHHGPDPNDIVLDRVVDCKGEPFGKSTVNSTIYLPMDAPKQPQAFNIGIKINKEVISKPLLLAFIETVSFD